MKSLNELKWAARNGESKDKLTVEEVAALVDLLGSGCRGETKALLARRLSLPLSLFPAYGIFDRVMVGPGNVAEYVAGQSYPDEIREVRKLLISG